MSQFHAIKSCTHSLIASLLVAVAVAAFYLPMKGEVIDSLYHIYLNAAPAEKAPAADAVFSELQTAQMTEKPLRYRELGKPVQADARLHELMSEYYFVQEHFELSLEAGRRAEGLLDQVSDLSLKSDVLSTLANAQFRLDDYDDALVSLLAAYRIDRKLGDNKLISSDLNTLAAIYLAVQQPIPGIHHIEKAIALERKLGRQNDLAIRLGMACELYLLNSETDKALQAIQEAYTLDSIGGRAEKAAIRLSQKGAVLQKTGQLDEARTLIEKALAVLEKQQNTYSIAVCHNQLGSIAQDQRRTSDAINHFKKALELSIQCGSAKLERDAERGLWETMREDNPTIAMLHLERYATLSDSLRNRIISLQMKIMDTTVQDMEQTEATKRSMRNQQLLLWAGALFGIMLLVTAIGLFRSRRRSHNALEVQRQSQELRSHFLSNITRELHTPLTVIMDAGQQLRDSSKSSREENERIGKMIVSQGNNMLEMINKLIDIDMVKDHNNVTDWKDGDIVLFTRLLVNNYIDEARQHGIRLDFMSPVKSLMVKFVPDHVSKILQSLISNSIVYTPRNGHIAVELSPLDNDRLRLIVTDTGKGIPPEELNRIYEPFTQDDKGVGTALSLSLVNHLVKTMNGEITVNSEPGKGTSFTIILPAQPSPKSHIERQEAAARFVQALDSSDDNPTKPLVFIVENDEDVAYLTANRLLDDYNLRFLSDGKEAYNQAQALIPDLIIASIDLSTMNGKELIRKMRSNDELKHIPVIAITDLRSDAERISCLEAGANAVLVKPFNTTELRLVTQQCIKCQDIMRDRVIRSCETVPDQLIRTLGKEDQQFLSKFVDIIYAQMSKQEINMDHAAAAMSVSRNQLRTRIMALTGSTPMGYALKVRLNYAGRLILSNEGYPLNVIATKCGFQNLSHFSNSFKLQFGMSPTQYRKNQL